MGYPDFPKYKFQLCTRLATTGGFTTVCQHPIREEGTNVDLCQVKTCLRKAGYTVRRCYGEYRGHHWNHITCDHCLEGLDTGHKRSYYDQTGQTYGHTRRRLSGLPERLAR